MQNKFDLDTEKSLFPAARTRGHGRRVRIAQHSSPPNGPIGCGGVCMLLGCGCFVVSVVVLVTFIFIVVVVVVVE
jgi:hypothetical protein